MENAKHTSMDILVKNHNKRACHVVMLISMKLCFGGEVVRAVSSESTSVSGMQLSASCKQALQEGNGDIMPVFF